MLLLLLRFLKRDLAALVVFVPAAVAAVVAYQFMDVKPSKTVRNYHANGRLSSEQTFSPDGSAHGPLRVWSDAGVLVMEAEFRNGEPISSKVYSQDGKLVGEGKEGRNYEMTRTTHP